MTPAPDMALPVCNYPMWNRTTDYKVGDIVMHMGKAYIAAYAEQEPGSGGQHLLLEAVQGLRAAGPAAGREVPGAGSPAARRGRHVQGDVHPGLDGLGAAAGVFLLQPVHGDGEARAGRLRRQRRPDRRPARAGGVLRQRRRRDRVPHRHRRARPPGVRPHLPRPRARCRSPARRSTPRRAGPWGWTWRGSRCWGRPRAWSGRPASGTGCPHANPSVGGAQICHQAIAQSDFGKTIRIIKGDCASQPDRAMQYTKNCTMLGIQPGKTSCP